MEAPADWAPDQTYQSLLQLSLKYPIHGPIAIQIYLDLRKVSMSGYCVTIFLILLILATG